MKLKLKHPIGSKVIVRGWPSIFWVTGVKRLHGGEILYELTAAASWAKEITVHYREKHMIPFTDHDGRTVDERIGMGEAVA